MFGMQFGEVLIVGIIAIVLFGRDLPGVARTAGQHYARFRKMLSDFSSQVNLHEIYDPNPSSYKGSHSAPKRAAAIDYDDHDEATAPRFQPPPAEDDKASG